MSSRQYLPPGVVLGVNLRRAPDHFSLQSPTAGKQYRLMITSASLYLKRLKIRDSVIPRAVESVRSGGRLTYNRLECRVIGIPTGSTFFNWLNVLNNDVLPNRIYVAFVFQTALYGNLNQISTYFEDMRMQSLNVKLNGRDLLVEPIRTTFAHGTDYALDLAKSDARDSYLTILEVLNQVSDQTSSLRIDYSSYQKGSFLSAIELGKCGEKSGSRGSLDIEVEFNEKKTKEAACLLVFTEKTETASFSPR
jgi:hypothetical protein